MGTAPRVSTRIFKSIIWATQRLRRVVMTAAIVVGAILGFALTNGFAYGLFSVFGIVLGIAVAVLLVRRADSLVTQNFPTP